MTFHLLTGEWPPQSGGVGDYTELLAGALAAQGCDVHVWCPAAPNGAARLRVRVHALPDVFGPRSRDALTRAVQTHSGAVILQYVPNALGRRGMNLPFCLSLRGLRRSGVDVRVMFHEPFFYFTATHPLRNVLAVAHRAMAAVLVRASTVTYVSTDAWRRLLAPYAPSAARATVLPIPSTVPLVHDSAARERWRAALTGGGRAGKVVGHFGTFGGHMTEELEAVIPEVLRAVPDAVFVCLGRRSEAFVSRFATRHPALAARIRSTGALERGELSAALQCCDLLVQPYPDGVTTRRTSVMAGLAHGIATVTTTGALTESVWAETDAVALAPASSANEIASEASRLLSNDTDRIALSEHGRRVYNQRFSMERTVAAILAGATAGRA